MARLSSEILGPRYQGDAGQVFHVICFRRYKRAAYDFRGSVFQLIKNWAYYAKNLRNMIL